MLSYVCVERECAYVRVCVCKKVFPIIVIVQHFATTGCLQEIIVSIPPALTGRLPRSSGVITAEIIFPLNRKLFAYKASSFVGIEQVD